VGPASPLLVFSGNSNRTLAERICSDLGLTLGDAQVGRFPDGEISVKIQSDVRGADVFVVQSTCAPVNDHLMELLVMIDAFRRASAARVTAVIPYFGYARQDRKDEGRVPITAKMVANLINAEGVLSVLKLVFDLSYFV
jgi:ribose-phosphate pyrophosphokinase